MFLDSSRFLVTISLISLSVSSLSWLFLTSTSVMLVLLSRESFRVLAFESLMKLHDMSNFLIVLFNFKNSQSLMSWLKTSFLSKTCLILTKGGGSGSLLATSSSRSMEVWTTGRGKRWGFILKKNKNVHILPLPEFSIFFNKKKISFILLIMA